VSARSLGRGRCPRCGEEGSVVVKWVGGKEYVYVKHGRTWHYVGPLDRVDVNELLAKPTTALPLRAAGEASTPSGIMGSKPGSPGKAAAAVLGLLLVALGAALAAIAVVETLLLLYLAPAQIGGVSIVAEAGFSVTLNGTDTVYAVAGPGEVSVTAQGAVFKVLIAPASYLNATWLRAGVRFAPIAVEEVQHLLDMFHGEYTSYSARLEPGQALLVWPCKLLASTAEVSFSLAVAQPSPQPPPQPVSIAQLVAAAILARTLPRLLIAALLIAAGYLLYKWSKSS